MSGLATFISCPLAIDMMKETSYEANRELIFEVGFKLLSWWNGLNLDGLSAEICIWLLELVSLLKEHEYLSVLQRHVYAFFQLSSASHNLWVGEIFYSVYKIKSLVSMFFLKCVFVVVVTLWNEFCLFCGSIFGI